MPDNKFKQDFTPYMLPLVEKLNSDNKEKTITITKHSSLGATEMILHHFRLQGGFNAR